MKNYIPLTVSKEKFAKYQTKCLKIKIISKINDDYFKI